MIKWLLMAALVAAVVWIWRKQARTARPAGRGARGTRLPMMVDCARCGVLLPAADAVHTALPGGGTRAYCSIAHRDAGPVAGTR